MLLIGDIHGKWTEYAKLLDVYRPDRSVQLGDFGWGFDPSPTQDQIDQLHYAMDNFGGDNRYIRGNHDNPAACLDHKYCIDDATYDEDTGIFYLGGASSIDREWRTPGKNWWPDEELSIDQLFKAVDTYEAAKPRVVLTHECPEDVVGHLMLHYRNEYSSRTRQALDSMWALHQPEIWVFGHWHIHVDQTIGNTRFMCLEELQVAQLDLDTLEINHKARYND
jgi:predicted phosphodiesterase